MRNEIPLNPPSSKGETHDHLPLKKGGNGRFSIWPSPAKINLFLHIIGRRADGYHLLQTIFQFLDYGDELRFTLRSDDKIQLTTSSPELTTENNLVLRA